MMELSKTVFTKDLFKSEDKDNTRYRLVGVIEHIGSSIAEGRCVAYVRGSRIASEQEPSSSPSSSWFCADNDTITEVSLDEVLKHEAFLLFYKRIEDRGNHMLLLAKDPVECAHFRKNLAGVFNPMICDL